MKTYQLNSTEELYIQKCVDLLNKTFGKDIGEGLLRSTVASIAIHAYQAGFDEANPY